MGSGTPESGDGVLDRLALAVNAGASGLFTLILAENVHLTLRAPPIARWLRTTRLLPSGPRAQVAHRPQRRPCHRRPLLHQPPHQPPRPQLHPVQRPQPQPRRPRRHAHAHAHPHTDSYSRTNANADTHSYAGVAGGRSFSERATTTNTLATNSLVIVARLTRFRRCSRCATALNGSTVSSAPPGWVQIAAVTSLPNPRLYSYYRVADAAEPASYTWTLSGSVATAAE
jgi:hypothetical protein